MYECSFDYSIDWLYRLKHLLTLMSIIKFIQNKRFRIFTNVTCKPDHFRKIFKKKICDLQVILTDLLTTVVLFESPHV